MSWPTTWASLRRYTQKAPCGCRYRTVTLGPVIDIQISPNRAQRCFKHRGATKDEVAAELLFPLRDILDG